MAKLWNRQVTEEEDFEIAQQIWGYYKAGARLWTKAQLRDAEEQLHQTTPYIVMDGIDGNKFRIPRTTGMVVKGEDDRVEHLAIDFRPIQRLVQGMKSSGRGRRIMTAFSTVMPTCVREYGMRPERLDSDAISHMWDECMRKWCAGATHKALVHRLYSLPLPDVGVEKIICFGLGDLDRDERPYFQHAAAMIMGEIMTEVMEKEVPVMLQDPDYSPASIEVLQKHGFKIIDGGVRGFIELDETTMVFTVAPNVPVKQLVTELARPAVMIWNAELDIPARSSFKGRLPDMEPEEERVMRYQDTDPFASRVGDMLRDEYTKYDFPRDIQNFGILEVCVKEDESTTRASDERDILREWGNQPSSV